MVIGDASDPEPFRILKDDPEEQRGQSVVSAGFIHLYKAYNTVF